MGHIIMSGIVPPLVSPGLPLGSLSEGTIVKLEENGSLVEFYVACQNYESALNGTGRTLLLRKDIHSTSTYSPNSSEQSYADANISRYVNETYAKNFTDDIISLVGTTKFYYTATKGSTSLSVLERSFFLLSIAEYGLESTYANAEGTALSVAELIRVSYLDGIADSHYTRTVRRDTFTNGLSITSSGNLGSTGAAFINEKGVRPCFTLPGTLKVNSSTMVIAH